MFSHRQIEHRNLRRKVRRFPMALLFPLSIQAHSQNGSRGILAARRPGIRGNTISSPLRGLEEFGDSADSRYLGREAQSFSVTVTTPNSNAEASSHSAHTETLDDVSSDHSSEQGRVPLAPQSLDHIDDLSPRAQKLSQTNRDSPQPHRRRTGKSRARCSNRSKGPPAGECAAPDFRERGPGGAFQKEGVSDRANGVPTNWEVPFGRGGRAFTASAARSSGVELDDFPDFTEAELAKIDALVEFHSNRSLSVRNIVPDLRGAGADNVFRKEGVVERAEKMPIDSVSSTRLNGERSRSLKTSQASLPGFPRSNRCRSGPYRRVGADRKNCC